MCGAKLNERLHKILLYGNVKSSKGFNAKARMSPRAIALSLRRSRGPVLNSSRVIRKRACYYAGMLQGRALTSSATCA